MKEVFKIFLLREVLIKDKNSGENYHSVIKTEVSGSFDTYKEALDTIEIMINNDNNSLFKIEKVFVSKNHNDLLWLF